MKKSKLLCKIKYKGLIDGELKELNAGDEFICSPSFALKLCTYYPYAFEVLDYVNIKEKKPTKDLETIKEEIKEIEDEDKLREKAIEVGIKKIIETDFYKKK